MNERQSARLPFMFFRWEPEYLVKVLYSIFPHFSTHFFVGNKKANIRRLVFLASVLSNNFNFV